MSACLGLDTSNYTTSAAVFDGREVHGESRLLQVRPGELGLRQSDAVFQHVKRLHRMTQALCAQPLPGDVAAVGASTRPREVEGSYMPCFLVGEGQAKTLAAVLGVPFYPCSHQQGHIAAAAWSSRASAAAVLRRAEARYSLRLRRSKSRAGSAMPEASSGISLNCVA